MSGYIITEPTIVFALVFAGLLIISWFVDRIAYCGKELKHKRKQYACGEEELKDYVPSSGFYKSIIDSLRFEKIRRMHTGNLTDYISWIITGLVLIVVAIILILQG